jgi:hypothetical protein
MTRSQFLNSARKSIGDPRLSSNITLQKPWRFCCRSDINKTLAVGIARVLLSRGIIPLLVCVLCSCGSEETNRARVNDVQEVVAGEIKEESSAANALSSVDPNSLLKPSDLVYRGAFRLPEGSNGSNWEYSGYAMAYSPQGDPKGPDDGYPGSIFGLGHDHHQMVSEIAIPEPILSAQKRLEDLNSASTLQPFSDIRGNRFGELEIPRAGLAVLSSKDSSQPGKLHFCWGQHFQFERAPSHGWSELNLAVPKTQGPWYLAEFTNYVTNDYLCPIPDEWSKRHLPGYRLATGRFRDGRWGGLGPALLAYQPPSESEPPPPKAVISEVRPLLMYGTPQVGQAELEVSDQHKLKGFSEADEWSGVCWLSGNRSAVLFVGTKALGKTWYGFANGVVYPTSGDPNEPVPETPPFPFDNRGWWSEKIAAQMLFYNPEDLAAVARGEKPTWEPQPYATLDLTPYLYSPGYDHERYKRYLLGDCCCDPANGIVYVFERQADGDKSLVHVFQKQ